MPLPALPAHVAYQAARWGLGEATIPATMSPHEIVATRAANAQQIADDIERSLLIAQDIEEEARLRPRRA